MVFRHHAGFQKQDITRVADGCTVKNKGPVEVLTKHPTFANVGR